MVLITCIDCKKEQPRHSRNAKRCLDCSNSRDRLLQKTYYARRKAGIPSKKGRSPGQRWVDFASRCVAFGKSMGVLPILDGSTQCADCAEAATCYDHRDYAKPFEVVAVCHGCNLRRGPASVPLPAGQLKAA